jgi:pyruvate dehydrogenase E2 component (dihydrolipoamide acetyltransferase)
VASPAVARLAERLGVPLDGLNGSGPGGRVMKRDVEAAARSREPAQTPSAAGAAPVPVPGARGAVEVHELTRGQAATALRMAQSKSAAPDYALAVVVDLTAAARLRAELGRVLEPAPSLNDMIVKACALALREHPRANGSYCDDRWELYERVNVGIAVAADSALLVPTILDADRKPLGRIAAEARDLVERARAGQLAPDELANGTFTVSNLGMFGIARFTAVLNPPQAAILAVGAAVPRPVVREGRVAVSTCAELTLTADHRILNGADAAAFLTRVAQLLEAPVRLAA